MAMKISGRRTRSVSRRYNITDSDTLHDAIERGSEMERVTEYVKGKTAAG